MARPNYHKKNPCPRDEGRIASFTLYNSLAGRRGWAAAVQPKDRDGGVLHQATSFVLKLPGGAKGGGGEAASAIKEESQEDGDGGGENDGG